MWIDCHTASIDPVINKCFFIWCLPNIPTAFYVDHLSKTKKQCTNARCVYTRTHAHVSYLYIYKHMYNIPEHFTSAVVSPFYYYLGQQLVYSNYGWKVCLPAVLSRSLSRSTQVMNFIKTFSMAANFSELALCVLWYSVFMPRETSLKDLVREWTSWFTILNHEPIWTIHWFIASKVWFIWESGISFDSKPTIPDTR